MVIPDPKVGALVDCYANCLSHRVDKDVAVVDLPGARAGHDGVHDGPHHVLVEDDLDSHPGYAVGDIGRAAIDPQSPGGTGAIRDFRQRHCPDPDLADPFLHVLQLGWLDDSVDAFHGVAS